jgi:esterase
MEDGKQVRLSSSLVSEGAATRMLYVLHGIFGSGRNWASVMRRFTEAKPEWAARLIDLRQHGDSQGFAPPHTIEATARDIDDLATANFESPAAILGHSFGGKVALMYAREHAKSIDQVWVIDSTPDARTPDGSAWEMLGVLRELPTEFANRDELIQLLRARRLSMPLAQWMATNLAQGDDGRYHWRFDLDALEQLLRAFFDVDLWGVLENPPGDAQIHMVKAAESNILSAEAVRRIEQLSSNGRVHLHVIDGGHWVNADNPGALLALMTEYL